MGRYSTPKTAVAARAVCAYQGGVAHAPLARYGRTIPRVLWWSYWGGLFLMSKVPLNSTPKTAVAARAVCAYQDGVAHVLNAWCGAARGAIAFGR